MIILNRDQAGPATPLMLAWTGVEPELPRQTAGDLRDIEDHDPTVRQARLVARYYTRQGVSCTVTVSTLDSGAPLDDTERRIRETIDYLNDAERLAQ